MVARSVHGDAFLSAGRHWDCGDEGPVRGAIHVHAVAAGDEQMAGVGIHRQHKGFRADGDGADHAARGQVEHRHRVDGPPIRHVQPPAGRIERQTVGRRNIAVLAPRCTGRAAGRSCWRRATTGRHRPSPDPRRRAMARGPPPASAPTPAYCGRRSRHCRCRNWQCRGICPPRSHRPACRRPRTDGGCPTGDPRAARRSGAR